MRNIRFYAASSAIVLALLIFGLSLLRGAEGIVVSDRLKKKAAENTALISGSTFEEKEKKIYKLPDTPAELSADQINTIVIDGIELDFPIKVKDLPEEFEIAPYYLSPVRSYDNTEKNEIDATLIYARQSIANVNIYSDETAVTDESVITDIRFSGEKSRYMPQITIGGIDINTPLKDMDRIYGSGSDIYTYLDFFAENENGAYCIGYDDYSLEREQIDYINRYYYINYEIPENERIKSLKNIYFYDEENVKIILPENYSPETDEINNSMEYVPIPENNEEMKTALDNFKVGDIHIRLPCTVNALMYSLGAEEASLEHYGSLLIDNKVMEITCSTAYMDQPVKFSAMVKRGQQLGDAQVSYVSSRIANFDNIKTAYPEESLPFELVYDDEYSFSLYSEDEDVFYYMTDYQYNNVFFYATEYGALDRTEIMYWPENLDTYEEFFYN